MNPKDSKPVNGGKVNLLDKITSVALSTLVAVVLSTVGAYVAISRAQENHETRLKTVESTQVAAPRAIDKAEEGISKRLDQIQTDIREIRRDQNDLLKSLAAKQK